MQDICRKLSRIGSVLLVALMVACAASVWAQSTPNEWKVGNVIVCFGAGTCQVMAVDLTHNTATLIDQISDSSNVTNPGNTFGVAINNTLHLLVTDDGGLNSVTNTAGSNIVQYQIAGVQPDGTPVTQGVSTIFDGGGGMGSAGIVAVALDNAGNMYSLNSNNFSPNITEISPAGSLVGSPISLQSQCGITTVASMDLSSQGTSAYVTSQGTIRNITLPGSVCTLFANLGSGVTFYGIKDIPASAQPVGCGTNNVPCNRETVLVVASGFFDSNGNGTIDSGDVNVCTNKIGQPAVSCALLLDTNGPAGSLTSPPWQANFKYSVGNQILDQNLNLQVVIATTSNSRSGRTTPNWQGLGQLTADNNVTWQNLGTSVLARYPVSGQTALKALALDPLLAPPATQTCSNGNCSATNRTVSTFWMADSASGNFFHINFTSPGSFTQFSTTPSCSGCGIQGIGVYGAEGAAQPGLINFGSAMLTAGSSGQTGPATFDFNPDGSDDNQATVTGFNFTVGERLPVTAYASAINPASGISDPLLTPAPPPTNQVFAPPAPCSVTTSQGQCVVWEFDNDPPQPMCTPTTLASCAFLGVQLEQFKGSSQVVPNFDTIAAVDEQFDITDTVDSGTHYLNSQISLHQENTANKFAACTYQPPLSPGFTQPPTCLTTTRNTIPFKFQCTQVSNQGSLLPFLHIVQLLGPNNTGPVEPLLVLNGTGGTTNYRFDTTGQQWVFNLNNPGAGSFIACTEDANHIVPQFCTNYTVQSSCP